MEKNSAKRERSRSRSPPRQETIKLHVSNLSLAITEAQISQLFSRFGKVSDVKVIRKSPTGQPLRDSVYSFVVMSDVSEGRQAMEQLNREGWQVNLSRHAREKAAFQPVLPLPTLQAFQFNAQATYIMLINNGKRAPNMPMDPLTLEKIISENHPSARAMEGIPEVMRGFYLVREVWIGNISPATDKKALFDTFIQFGKIEGIEMFSSKCFAFIKYRKVMSATLAYERGQGLMVDSRPVKVAFADPTRRIDIIGDSVAPDDPNFNPVDDENFRSLYLSYSPGSLIPTETKLREVFNRYGIVTGIYVKKHTDKPYAFVDFEKGEQASLARKLLYLEDPQGTKRKELGDSHLDISFKNTNNIVNKNGVKNGVKYQDRPQNYDVKEMAQKLLQGSSDVISCLQVPLDQTQIPSEPQNPQVLSDPAEDSNIGNVIWSGFMTRSKQHRVGVDLTMVKGEDCMPEKIYNLNITHRVHFPEIAKYSVLATVTMEASNETQQPQFNNYINYFTQKKRVGYIPLKNYAVYVVPPLPEALVFYKDIQPNQLLALIVDPAQRKTPEEAKAIVQQLEKMPTFLQKLQDVSGFSQEKQNPTVLQI